jgi:proteasome assembly chaperone (PAC2) family protein
MERMGIVSGGTYEGPTGISSAIIQIAKDRGIDHTGFWGHVPHYIQTNPNPVVMESILDKLRSVVGISVDLKELEGESAAFIERCEEAIKDDPSIRDYVERLEKYFDDIIIEEDLEIFSQPELGSPQNTHGPSDFPTTEDLVEDLENFLRKRRNAD